MIWRRSLLTLLLFPVAAVLAQTPGVLKSARFGSSVAVRRLSQERFVKDHEVLPVDRLSYTRGEKSAILQIENASGSLQPTDLSLLAPVAPSGYPLVVLRYRQDNGRDCRYYPEFVEFDGSALHRLPQISIRSDVQGAGAASSTLQNFCSGSLLYAVQEDHTRQPDTSSEMLRFRLVTLADASHAVITTRTLLGAESLDQPGRRGPDPEITWQNVPLRLYKTELGVRVLVPAVP